MYIFYSLLVVLLVIILAVILLLLIIILSVILLQDDIVRLYRDFIMLRGFCLMMMVLIDLKA